MKDTEKEITIDQIVEDFAARLAAGEQPTIEEYQKNHPQLAEQVEAVLKALLALEEIDSQSSERRLFIDDSIPQLPNKAAPASPLNLLIRMKTEHKRWSLLLLLNSLSNSQQHFALHDVMSGFHEWTNQIP